MKSIVLTGGGSGGHIAPIRAIATDLQKTKELYWIGSSPFEEGAAENLGIEFKKIHSGKMRRGMNLLNIYKNIIDIFWIKFGFFQSLFFLKKIKPERIFSTGGFVSVPVVLAAWVLRIPVIIHEQTIGFGLANKIAGFFAQKILLAFPQSKKHIPRSYYKKIEIVGNPIRADLFDGNFGALKSFLNSDLISEKPILYITGGGQGSQLINDVIFKSLETLTEDYYVIHQTGKSGIVEAKQKKYNDYFPFDFVAGNELSHIYACSNIVIARAGAGTVNELNYFGIYSIFTPLQPTQNDEQMKNAEWFLEKNSGEIIKQIDLNMRSLLNALDQKKHSEIKQHSGSSEKYFDSKELILKNLL